MGFGIRFVYFGGFGDGRRPLEAPLLRPRRVPGAPGIGHRPTAPLAAHLRRPGASTHFHHKGRSSRSPSVPDLHRDSSGAATVLPGSYHRAAPCMAQGPAVGPVQAYYVPDTEPVQEPVGSAKTTVLRGAAGHRAFLDVVPALAPQGGAASALPLIRRRLSVTQFQGVFHRLGVGGR